MLARALSLRQLRLENMHLQQAMGIDELSLVIRLTLGFDTVLQKVADAAMGHTRISGFPMLVPSEDQKVFYVAVARGTTAERDLGKRVPFSRGLAR